MSKKMKLSLDNLRVQSFVTSMQDTEKKAIKGGIGKGTITDCICSETFWVPCDCNSHWACPQEKRRI